MVPCGRQGAPFASTVGSSAWAAIVWPVSLADRYRAGEYEQVWNELTALGDQARSTDSLTAAEAVADETMQRARRNVELLADLLPGLGWQFARPRRGDPGDAVVAPLTPAELTQLDRLERELGGPLPI
jgi:hypothetical protein